MEVLGAILLVELFVGVLFFRSARSVDTENPDPQQRDGILDGESVFAIAPLRIAESVQIRHLQRFSVTLETPLQNGEDFLVRYLTSLGARRRLQKRQQSEYENP